MSTMTDTTAYIITRDGKPTYGRYATENDAFSELLKRQPMSTDWAMRHEGWGIEEVPADRWSDKEAENLRAIARSLLTRHDHTWDFYGREDREMTRENCGACVLNGYHPTDEGPNYAGWARVFIQAGRPVPEKWHDAFRAELASENELYAAALRMDIRTFGGWTD